MPSSSRHSRAHDGGGLSALDSAAGNLVEVAVERIDHDDPAIECGDQGAGALPHTGELWVALLRRKVDWWHLFDDGP